MHHNVRADSADKDVLLMMREHARVRRAQSDRQRASAHAPTTCQVPARVAAGPTPRAALQERERTVSGGGPDRYTLGKAVGAFGGGAIARSLLIMTGVGKVAWGHVAGDLLTCV